MLKKILFATFLIIPVILTISCSRVNTLPGEFKDLDKPEKLKEAIEKKNPDIMIIDVRSKEEYRSGYIPTAININYQVITAPTNLPPKEKYLILYCRSGRRAGIAADNLIEEGYEYVLNWGGINRWTYELEK